MAADPKTRKLTNGQVKTALVGYEKYRSGSLDYDIPNDVLRSFFGFDLHKLADVREVIDKIVSRKNASPSANAQSQLSPFRYELILAAAAATRRDLLFLTSRLYTATMERHSEYATNSRYLDDAAPSAAGEYLLRCMAVQATYSNFGNYLLVLHVFAALADAIAEACTGGGVCGIDVFLTKAAGLALTRGIGKDDAPPPGDAGAPSEDPVAVDDERGTAEMKKELKQVADAAAGGVAVPVVPGTITVLAVDGRAEPVRCVTSKYALGLIAPRAVLDAIWFSEDRPVGQDLQKFVVVPASPCKEAQAVLTRIDAFSKSLLDEDPRKAPLGTFAQALRCLSPRSA